MEIFPRTTEPMNKTISEQVFDYALKVFVVLSTFFYMSVPNGNINPIEWNYQVQELFFRYGTILLFGFSLFSAPKRRFESRSLGFFIVYACISSFLFNFELGVRRVILNIFFGLLFYQMVYERIRLDELKKYVSWLFWILVANLGLCFFQWFDNDLIFNHVNHSIVPISELVCGFMRLQASLGILAALIGPVLFIIHPLTALVALPLMFWGKSSISIAGFVAAVAFISWFRIERWKWFLLAGVVFVAGASYIVLFDMPSGQFDERFKIWNQALKVVLSSSPYTGMSLGSFAKWEPLQTQATNNMKLGWIWAHNEYIQTFFEMGIIGITGLFFYFKGRFKDIRESLSIPDVQVLSGFMISLMIISFAQFPFHAAKLVVLCLFLMATLHSKAKEDYLA